MSTISMTMSGDDTIPYDKTQASQKTPNNKILHTRHQPPSPAMITAREQKKKPNKQHVQLTVCLVPALVNLLQALRGGTNGGGLAHKQTTYKSPFHTHKRIPQTRTS